MNLFLHGARDFKITQGDTLRSPNYINAGQLQTFDCVIANPPFGLKAWGASAFETDAYGRNIWGCPSDSNADFAWLQHMIKSMNPATGRVAVVMPQGVLFHGGKEGEIRKQIVESDKIECIITLVGGIFYGAGVSACLILMNNQKVPDHKNKICMIDATSIYTPARAQNYMSEDDIQLVFNLFSNYKDEIEKVKIVALDDVREKDYTLSVNTYIEKKEQEVVSPDIVRQNYFDALQEVKDAEYKMKELLIKGGYVNE